MPIYDPKGEQPPQEPEEKSDSLAALIAECQQLADALGKQHHVPISFGPLHFYPLDLRPAVEQMAVHNLLVSKGICTEEEFAIAMHTVLRDVLRQILQAEEEKPKVAAVKKPGLIVPGNGNIVH